MGSLNLPDNYIYLYHTDEYFILPQYPDSIDDSIGSTFSSTQALSRTAPIYSYSYSGPRTVSFTLTLHRDLMDEYNKGASNVRINGSDGDVITNITDDYVDLLIKKLQSVALPNYDEKKRQVQPPMIALRYSNEIFIRGVVNGGINLKFSGPVLNNGKYAMCNITFSVYEVTPFDADSVGQLGSFRGVTSGIKSKVGL